MSKAKYSVYHMASMARSGETLLLRTLNTHPSINVPWQIHKRDSQAATELVLRIRNLGQSKISLSAQEEEGLCIKRDQVILIKQGIWEQKHPFNGFVLVRNPVSIYSSLIEYDRFRLEYDHLKTMAKSLIRHRSFDTNKERLIRWMNDIDKSLVSQLANEPKLERFCTFYNRRMFPLVNIGLPIIKYELFIQDPAKYLKQICSHFEVEYCPSLIQSHEDFKPEVRGHGRMNLSQPINSKSQDKYKLIISRSEFSKIRLLTEKTWKAYGYDLQWDNIVVN